MAKPKIIIQNGCNCGGSIVHIPIFIEGHNKGKINNPYCEKCGIQYNAKVILARIKRKREINAKDGGWE